MNCNSFLNQKCININGFNRRLRLNDSTNAINRVQWDRCDTLNTIACCAQNTNAMHLNSYLLWNVCGSSLSSTFPFVSLHLIDWRRNVSVFPCFYRHSPLYLFVRMHWIHIKFLARNYDTLTTAGHMQSILFIEKIFRDIQTTAKTTTQRK